VIFGNLTGCAPGGAWSAPSAELADRARKTNVATPRGGSTYETPVGYQGDAVSFKQAYFTYDGDGRTTGLYEYGWQLYPTPYSYSGTTLAEQVNYGYDDDGRLTGCAGPRDVL